MKVLAGVGVISVLLAGCVSAPKEGDVVMFLKGGFPKGDSAIAQQIRQSEAQGRAVSGADVSGTVLQATNPAAGFGQNALVAIAVGELVSLIPQGHKRNYKDDDFVARIVKGGTVSKGFTVELKYNDSMKNMKQNDQVRLIKDANGNLTLVPL